MIWLCLYLTLPLEASQIIISPQSVYPGDAFFIKTDYKGLLKAAINGREFFFSSCGNGCSYTIGAIDIETEPGVYKIRIEFLDGRVIFKRLRVKKPEFPVITMELPEDKVTLSPEDALRAEREDQLLRSLWNLKTKRLWQGGFIKPLSNEVSTGYGVKRIINKHKLSIHKGIDIRATEGEPVKAVNNGRVILTKELFFGGKTIVIDHGEGLFSVYMHLSEYAVSEGDTVSKGQTIGFTGSTGRASGPHLHFGFKVGDISVNPESFFVLMGSLTLQR